MTCGVLLLAYGSPGSVDEVEPYFTHIRGGRTPGAEAVHRLRQRYEIVGGRSPLLGITNAVRDALQQWLDAASPNQYRVYVAMKHWHPFISEVVPRIAADGVAELTVIALAPHYSRMSIGGYQAALDEAVRGLAAPPSIRFVQSWHLHAPFLDHVARSLATAMSGWPHDVQPHVVTVFSAHSLPVRIRSWNDPYERQVLESCHAVASRAGIDQWRVAWQSAGDTGEPWLGPDINEALAAVHRDGVRHVLAVPIGFVSDHLEILYDIDYEAMRTAARLGLTLRRTALPNADPPFVAALGSLALGEHTAPVLAALTDLERA